MARTAAKSGWARVKHDLVNEFQTVSVKGSNGTTSYRGNAVVNGREAVVTLTGLASIPGRADTTRYKITYRLESVGGDQTPEFASRALAVDGDLTMSGNGSIVSPGLPGPQGDAMNVQVHANGNIHAGSGSTVVEGFGTYASSKSGKINSTFRPRANPSNAPVLQKTDSVYIPTVVPSEILAAYGGADTFYPAGSFYAIKLQNVTLPGGTRDDPMVYYVKGGAALINVTFDGYALFIAEGEVKLQATVTGTPEAGRNESALAVFTTGEVSMAGGSEAHASLHTNGGLRYRGGVDIYGNLIVAGDLSNGGGATIHSVPTTPSLFRTWGWVDPAFRLAAYREQ